uniref:Uncharacterized protein n=1 Tax=Anguilla anguilla TaxID=7936 RepID=A0A0E9Q9X5_ANGAN
MYIPKTYNAECSLTRVCWCVVSIK